MGRPEEMIFSLRIYQITPYDKNKFAPVKVKEGRIRSTLNKKVASQPKGLIL
ncbi:MAG: hypothetical protein OEZ30_06895 [Candidatus Aminicenantes bacterium]|nr:hypothetical protein [Candidatus Aminicenantes bacterium]